MTAIKDALVAAVMKSINQDIVKRMLGFKPTTNNLVKAAQKSLVNYVPGIFEHPHTRTLEFDFKIANPINGVDGLLKPTIISFKLPVNEAALLLRSSQCKNT